MAEPKSPPASFAIGMLMFPDMTQLDMTGPYEVFAAIPGVKIYVIWKSLDPVRTDRGLVMLPNASLADCPKLDLICVPGGPGTGALMEDPAVLAFLKQQAATCRYVTSVCTGSLVLGAAGLLQGYRAACHWASLDLLRLLGAEPVAERVVIDRNRITGGGVTSGIDFAFRVIAEIWGEAQAKTIQLALEYDPAPPFTSGSPKTAPQDVLARAQTFLKPLIEKRCVITQRAATALGL
jgi:cyclohexyl-isocyanide hydratase